MNTGAAQQSGLVYHHTDHGGILGILSNATFRFSAIEYLNDSAERNYVVEYINRYLTGEAEKYEDGDPMLTLFEELRGLNRLIPAHYYIGCFTRSLNELSQWRGYSRTVPSYAIAFRQEALVEATEMIMQTAGKGRVWAAPVTYGGPTRPAPLVDEYIQGRIASMRSYIESARGTEIDRTYPSHTKNYAWNVASALSTDFLQQHQPAFLKHDAFVDENEFRIAIRYSAPSLGKPVEFGVTAGTATMKPYIELTYGKDCMSSLIDHMIVGPTPEKDLACRALKQYITSQGYDFAVRYCDIPFRPGW